MIHGQTKGDQSFHDRMLTRVSRTFALTIPQLPAELRRIVANAYLLCRIADTIEDESALSFGQKTRFHEMFTAVLADGVDGRTFARQLHPLLSTQSTAAERELIRNTSEIVGVTSSFHRTTRNILHRRISIMCQGMPFFQRQAAPSGLRNMAVLDQYCYYVAGVVGEMLTELFSDYADDINARHEALLPLATSFGQGLQMTNILKDVWEDLERGVCWLPHETFSGVGYDMNALAPGHQSKVFAKGMTRVIAVAHAHLRNALTYTLLIPARHKGVRRFCLWSLGLAVLTLQRIHRLPEYTNAQQVKLKRRVVYATIYSTGLAAHSDILIRALFSLAAKGLPLAPRAAVFSEFDDRIEISGANR